MSLLSFGVGDDVSFELDLSNKVELIHLYDFSVSELPVDIPNATFFQKGVAARRDLDFITFRDAVNEFGAEAPLILKMDIEGYEWEVLNSIEALDLDRFHQIVIEFHGLTDLKSSSKFEIMKESFLKLNEFHSPLIVHPNNFGDYKIVGNVPVPDVIEVTYLHRNIINQYGPTFIETKWVDAFANNPARPEISLTFHSNLNSTY
jgi:hypothetical protein